MLWHEPKHTLPLSKLLVRLSLKAFLCQEAQTLTAHQEKPTSPFPLRSKRKRNNLRSGNEVAWPVELFGSCLGNRKNASTDRSSPTGDPGEFTLINSREGGDQ